jgi:hypothetical protein
MPSARQYSRTCADSLLLVLPTSLMRKDMETRETASSRLLSKDRERYWVIGDGEMRTEEGLLSGHVFCSLEIALLDEGLCRCRKIALEIQQRVGRELGVATFRLKGSGG